MEIREKYIDDVITNILAAHRTELRQTVSPLVEETVRGVEDKMRQLLEKAMRKSLDHVEARYKEYAKRCVSLQKEQEEELERGQMDSFSRLRRGISTVERHDKNNFKHRAIEVFDRKLASNHRHREVLMACFKPLMDDLMLPETDLQDELFEQGILSYSENASIRERRSSRERNMEFLNIICGRLTYEEFNTVFLPALQKHHAPLCVKLVEVLDKLQEDENHVCTSCRVRKYVQVKRLTASLVQSKAITFVQHSDLTSAGTSNRDKWGLLVKEKISPAKIIDSFEEKYPDFYREFKRHKRETLDCFCNSDASHVGEDESIEGEGHDELDGRFSTFTESTTASTIGRDSAPYDDIDIHLMNTTPEGYKMNDHNHGHCLIINNIQFNRDILRTRDGAEQDGSRLEKTFRTLGFKVHMKQNLSSGQIKTVIDKYAKRTDHSWCDTFVCCLLSHGKSDYIYGSDGVRISIQSITSEFTASKCPTLAGKPKLFFMQVDRGKDIMKAHVLEGEPETPAEDHRPGSDKDTVYTRTGEGGGLDEHAMYTEIRRGSHEETVYMRLGKAREVIADESDFLLGYCTSPGHVSFRSSRSGSWYIKALCEVLESQADRQDLLSCLTLVNDQVARSSALDEERARPQQQVPAPVFTLRKKVFLTIDPQATP